MMRSGNPTVMLEIIQERRPRLGLEGGGKRVEAGDVTR